MRPIFEAFTLNNRFGTERSLVQIQPPRSMKSSSYGFRREAIFYIVTRLTGLILACACPQTLLLQRSRSELSFRVHTQL
jgi:hypothetical protein